MDPDQLFKRPEKAGSRQSKFWWKIEGDQTLAGPSEGEVEFQALFSRLVAPFWDFQAGLRYDRTWGAGRNLDRAFLTIGFEGLAPYWFEIEPAIFISEKGDISARVAVTYDLMLTQKLVLQPRIDLNAAVQDVPSFGIGAGGQRRLFPRSDDNYNPAQRAGREWGHRGEGEALSPPERR